ncbi:MAG: D-alanine--D-alanine ligase [Oscillospiraceae bacterium]|nr:D-alanine--D-alanine ligase [Oscillospiraceae bacterium]
MNIVVLCGGLSNERDVSLSTGHGVANALRDRGHNVVLMDLFFGCQEEYDDPKELFVRKRENVIYRVERTVPDLDAIRAQRKQNNNSLIGDNVLEICAAADMTFLALHGEEGENGKLQAMLDIAGIRYTGAGYLGSAMAMNKGVSKMIFRESGIPTAPAITLKKEEKPYGNVGYPCVVKPCSGGSSVGTAIVNGPNEYDAAVADAFRYEDEVIVEKFISGRELTVGVMDGKAMPVIEIIPKAGFYDYKNKYQAGLTEEICPAQISDEDTGRVQRLAEQVFKALHLDVYGRVDFIMENSEEKTLYCLEANTLPGMTPTSLIPQMGVAMGMSYGELCEKIIEVSMEKYRK